MAQFPLLITEKPLNRKTVTINESEWAKYSKMGATKGKCPTPKPVIIKICLNGKTMSINEKVWHTYQSKGATRGACKQKSGK